MLRDVCFDKLINGFRWLTKKSDNTHVVQKGDLFEVDDKHTCKRTLKGWVNEDLQEGGPGQLNIIKLPYEIFRIRLRFLYQRIILSAFAGP